MFLQKSSVLSVSLGPACISLIWSTSSFPQKFDYDQDPAHAFTAASSSYCRTDPRRFLPSRGAPRRATDDRRAGPPRARLPSVGDHLQRANLSGQQAERFESDATRNRDLQSPRNFSSSSLRGLKFGSAKSFSGLTLVTGNTSAGKSSKLKKLYDRAQDQLPELKRKGREKVELTLCSQRDGCCRASTP